jgi:hypothetical protein
VAGAKVKKAMTKRDYIFAIAVLVALVSVPFYAVFTSPIKPRECLQYEHKRVPVLMPKGMAISSGGIGYTGYVWRDVCVKYKEPENGKSR